MKVSLNWLREYVKVSLLPKELAEKLTMSGTEVGGLETIGRDWDKVVVGQVVALEKHPNAERLQLATIDLGGERLTVVCGAPNLKVGDKVPFARVGAELFDGHTGETFKLKPARIRGVASEGMACSEKELGISDRHEGVMILPPEAPVGTPLAQYLGDTIFDLKVTPNRPDCLSVIGMAREVAALTGQKVTLPEVRYNEPGPPIGELVSVDIADPDLCSRYCASLVSEVVVAPSPHWMQERLLACGMRPINNIVDITNYVMLEYGQPLHAFDYRKIKRNKVIVRRGGDGEALTTLDGMDRPITGDMLVIANRESPIAIAGVMGGAESEVTEETSTILLESANFNKESIRRTSTRLRLRSEASLRFEKGLSPELAMLALRRATQLIVSLAGGQAARGIIDVYPGRVEKGPILLTTRRVSQVLGIELSLDQIVSVLSSLGFSCEVPGPSSELLVTVPYWRTDLRLADDLVEELARIIGYDQIPATMLGSELPRPQPVPALALKEKVRDILVGCGMQEVITYSLTSRDVMDKVFSPTPIRVANPITTEQEYLRTNIRAGLLATLSANEKHEGSIRLFEVGRIYLPREDDLPEELEVLGGVLSGARLEGSWLEGQGQLDFYDAKGVLEVLFNRLGVEAAFEAAEDPALLPGRTAGIVIGGATIGVLGELNPRVAESFAISSQPVYLFEVSLEKLLPLVATVRKYSPLPRFPGIVRDIAVVVDARLPSGRVQDIIQDFPMVSQVTLFDVYTGEKVPLGKKSLAFSIVYQSPTRTLTDEEVDEAQQELLERLERELGATLRR